MNKLYQEFRKIFMDGADDLTVVAYVEAVSEALDSIAKPLALEFELSESEMNARLGRVKAKLKKKLEDQLGEDPVDPTTPTDPTQPQG